MTADLRLEWQQRPQPGGLGDIVNWRFPSLLGRLRMNIGDIQAEIQGISSNLTRYDSLSSHQPHDKPLPSGISENKYYFIFPGKLTLENARSITLKDTGIKLKSESDKDKTKGIKIWK